MCIATGIKGSYKWFCHHRTHKFKLQFSTYFAVKLPRLPVITWKYLAKQPDFQGKEPWKNYNTKRICE